MIWEIVCRIGDEDCFEPDRNDVGETVYLGIGRKEDRNVVHSDVERVLKTSNICPSPFALDLLHLAMTVYAADRSVPRKYAYNRWERGFHLFMPVSDPDEWQRVKGQVEKMLHFLTSDHWELHFRARQTEVAVTTSRDHLPESNEEIRAVALLSGGLDSFVGAVDLLEENTPVAFVSHHNRGSVVRTVQNNVYSLLTEYYPNQFETFRFFVQPAQAITGEVESSSRSRSMLFLALGVIIGSSVRTGVPLYVAENGFMSINVPLAANRVGSLATRTTHPYFLQMFQEVLYDLKLNLVIETRYRFQTKGEMLQTTSNSKLTQQGIGLTLSCSNSTRKRFAGISPYAHCGYCLPCIVRRAATHAAGFKDVSYSVDILRNPRGEDLRALKGAIMRVKSSEDPLIFEVLKSGPLSDHHPEYAGVYKRGISELAGFLDRSDKD